MEIINKQRIESVDILRGVVMVLMALDHVRDFFHFDAFIYDPTDLSKTTPLLFFTRFITHLCAPVFCFLAGTSAYFTGKRRSRNSLSKWLLTRGLWLILLEFTIVRLGWYFKINPTFLDFLVIWSLGISMIFLAGLIHLPRILSISLALFFVFGHNLLDNVHFTDGTMADMIWSFFHEMTIIKFENFTFYIIYPVMPWIGLMALGYYTGKIFDSNVVRQKRIRYLSAAGLILLALFAIFRGSNIYGDPRPWTDQNNPMFSFLSVLNVSKYPPSFSYICITMGLALLLLALFESLKNKLLNPFRIIGQVPLFFYILHIYLIHFLALIAAVGTGFTIEDMLLETWVGFTSELKGYGFSLSIVYLVWIIVVLLLYPLCVAYNRYRIRHPEKKWLSYL